MRGSDVAEDRGERSAAQVPPTARVHELLAGGQDVQTAMGAAFGTDFSSVKIASDGRAEQFGAQAYAQGDSIHVAAGRGSPMTLHGDAAAPAQGAAQAKPGGAPIQLLDGHEHRDLGSSATGVPGYEWQTADDIQNGGAAAAGANGLEFIMTHGDMVSLWRPIRPEGLRDTKRPNPNSLFRLASTPSANIVKQLGTQDEIVYAIQNYSGPRDPRVNTSRLTVVG
ncbi:MAG TPA: DUF4157 domain-containing protein [Kofleriaceae bacterium]|nr:DUF4157 domain-containing protein [Kofleriaceae bacterium]